MLTIFDTTRTPFLKLGTQFSQETAADLGTHVAKTLIMRNDLPADSLDETIFGCVCQPPDSANIARIIALRSGVDQTIPAVTVNRNCASGMEALITASQRIAANRGELFLVGGVDNMSQVPFYFRESTKHKLAKLARSKTTYQKLKILASFRPHHLSPVIGLAAGLTDPFINMEMGQTAEYLANTYSIKRADQDSFANLSHRKAVLAEKAFTEEISPYLTNGQSLNTDNGIRANSSVEKLSQLRPVFDRTTGTVTAGNSSQITDGAAALLVGTPEAGKRHFLKPIAHLKDYSIKGCDPKAMGLGPVFAIRELMEKNHLTVKDVDIFEINEAFAAQVLACIKELASCHINIPEHKLNPLGGAIALGHPVGATGARLAGSIALQLKRNNQKRAIASLCVGGGQGVALLIET